MKALDGGNTKKEKYLSASQSVIFVFLQYISAHHADLHVKITIQTERSNKQLASSVVVFVSGKTILVNESYFQVPLRMRKTKTSQNDIPRCISTTKLYDRKSKLSNSYYNALSISRNFIDNVTLNVV